MANPVASNYVGPVAKTQVGYNGVTGSPARWNEEEGYWIDADGQRIRDDAIVPTGKPSGGGAAPVGDTSTAPSAPAAPGLGGGQPGNGLPGSGGAGYGGLGGGAGSTPQQASMIPDPTLFDFGRPARANPALGQRSPALQGLLGMFAKKPY